MVRVTFDRGEKVRRVERHLQNPSAVLNQIGLLMVAESHGAFKAQEFGGKKWDPRSVPNVYGILADFAAGKKEPAKRRFQGRPALQDTGRLAQSIAHRVVGDAVEVGSNLPYAAVHNFGGAIESATITKKVQTSIWKWLKKQDKSLKRSLGWLLNPKFTDTKLVGKVPARQFVGLTKQTVEFARRAIATSIMEAR